jgi:hypothetical protein
MRLFDAIGGQNGDALEVRFADVPVVGEAMGLDHFQEVELIVNRGTPVDAPVNVRQIKIDGWIAGVLRHQTARFDETTQWLELFIHDDLVNCP